MTDINDTSAAFKKIRVEQLKPNPWNRQQFDSEELKGLIGNVKVEGVKDPLRVRPLPDGTYEISSGHRRWMAAQQAGIQELWCWVESLSDEEVAHDNISLNIQRENIPALELARMVKRYMDDFRLSQEVAGQKFGKSRQWVGNLTGFLEIKGGILENASILAFGWPQLEALKASSEQIQIQIGQELKAGTLKAENIVKRCAELSGQHPKPAKKGKKVASAHVPAPAPLPDPLAESWSKVRSSAEMTPFGHLSVAYSPHPEGTALPKSPFSPAVKGWLLWMEDLNEKTDGETLANRFQAMAGILKSTKQARTVAAPQPAAVPEPKPAAEEDEEPLNPRIAAMIAEHMGKEKLV